LSALDVSMKLMGREQTYGSCEQFNMIYKKSMVL